MNFGKSNEQPLLKISLDDAKKYFDEGHFKREYKKIKAAMYFLKHHGKKVIITSIAGVVDAINGSNGTTITNEIISKETQVIKRFFQLNAILSAAIIAQDKFIFEPPQLEVELGESKTVIIKLVNEKNALVKSSFSMYSAHDPGVGPTPDWPGTSLSINPRVSDGSGKTAVAIKPNRSGKLKLKVQVQAECREMTVLVPKPSVKKLDISEAPSKVT